MIYPSERLVALAAVGAPVALVIGVLVPGLWLLPLGWLAFVLALAAVDLALAAPGGALTADFAAPPLAFVGQTVAATLRLAFARRPVPALAEAALTTGARFALADRGRLRVPLAAGQGGAAFALHAARRGPAPLGPLDVRWRGPFGLVWRQKRLALDRTASIVPDLRPVRDEAPRLLARDAPHGQRVQQHRGESLEFDALGTWRPGEDRRRIDWKHSARHLSLIAKETRVERDNAIMLAVDCGRLMTAPVGGLARLDRAITAALLTGYVALKSGDRVGMFGFDRVPRAQLPPALGVRTFAQLQAAMGGLEYAEAETNFTLGLSRLGQVLTRRTLILLFTDFTDTIGAELMLRAVAPLLKRHRLVCVVIADEELETLIDRAPEAARDVTRAVIAADLLRERRIVFERLRRLGVEVVEARYDALGPAVVRRYLDMKARGPL